MGAACSILSMVSTTSRGGTPGSLVRKLLMGSVSGHRVLEAAVEMATSQGDDCVGPPNRPEHTGLFETRTDDGLAARFDDAGANKEVLTAELGVTHALGI